MASYKFLFASYYVVKRKPFHGSSEGFRKVVMSGLNHLGRRRQLTVKDQKKMDKKKQGSDKNNGSKDFDSEELSDDESSDSAESQS